MNLPLLMAVALTLASWTVSAPARAAESASGQLITLDETLFNGNTVLRISRYPAPDKGSHKHPLPVMENAEILFERPDRFRVVLRPGDKDELRIVAEAGIVRWFDMATGMSGKAETSAFADPLVLALLGTAGEIKRFASIKDVALDKQHPLTAARLDPGTYGTQVEQATAWFDADQPAGFGFVMRDGSRLFLAVMQYKPNVPTKPDDFQ